MEEILSVPKLIAFDLDGTLWEPEMYQLWGGGSPFSKAPNGNLKDCKGREVYLLGNSRQLLQSLGSDAAYKDTILSYVSTCDEPVWARECLTKFDLDVAVCDKNGTVKGNHTMHTLVHHHEIYKAYSKQVHFKKLQQKTLIRFQEMIFFDNQMNNIQSVSELGVHCVYCPEGMTDLIWTEGLAEWRNKKAKRSKSLTAK